LREEELDEAETLDDAVSLRLRAHAAVKC